jgi:hypothetical protein
MELPATREGIDTLRGRTPMDEDVHIPFFTHQMSK